MTSVFYRSIQLVYNKFVRERLPKGIGNCAGVPTRYGRVLDFNPSWPNYKRGLIDAIYEHCNGQTVELIALGRGVSSIHAIRAGATEVIAYEAAAEMIETATETFDNCPHDATDKVEIRHNLVGDDIKVYGEEMGEPISPTDLEGYDVLILDSEGAEASILSGLKHRPSVCIVETHPEMGVSTSDVRELLDEMYDDIRRREYEPDNPKNKAILIGVE